MTHIHHTPSSSHVFEATTTYLHLLTLALILATFPNDAPLYSTLLVAVGIVAIYNICRLMPGLRTRPLFSSSAISLAVDVIFTSTLIGLVGNISTPYTGLLVFTVIIGTYLYQIRGALVVVGAQTLALLGLSFWPLTSALSLDTPRLIAITMYVLLGFGILLERLTRADRKERTLLVRLQHDSERERQRLMTLVDSLSSAIFVTDAKGKIVEHNDAAHALTASKSNLIGKKFSDVVILHPRNNPAADHIDILHGTSGPQHRRDLSSNLVDGNSVDLDITITPVTIADKDSAEYIIVCEDITIERSLDQQRSEFISVASHELRTPLAIIEAALETALMTPLTDLGAQTRELIDQAHRNTSLLAGIVKDITLLAEAQNDNLPVQLTQITAHEIFDGLTKDFAEQAEQKGLKLAHHISQDTPSVLSTTRYIQEILQNYLTNAIKYSPEGTVTLSAEPAKNGGILFSVEDQGIGISPKNQKLLFSKFFRAEDYRTRSTGGTGLGLYLCLEIAQRLGATVWCKSTLDEGSTFFLEVPAFSNLRRDQGEVVTAQVANLVDDL